MKVLLVCISGIVILFPGSSLSQEVAQEPEYFRMRIYVFKGSYEQIQSDNPRIEPIVERALNKLTDLQKFKGYQLIDKIAWMVRSDGDIDRFLDIPERWWNLAQDVQISFRLIYNHSDRYLSLTDFRFMIKQVPRIHTTVGVRNGGAAVIGQSYVDKKEETVFFIVTLEVRPNPYPGQSPKYRFFVENEMKQEHDH